MINQHATERCIVTGENMQATPDKQMLAKVCSAIQMILLALVIAGDVICKAVGIQTPEIVKTL